MNNTKTKNKSKTYPWTKRHASLLLGFFSCSCLPCVILSFYLFFSSEPCKNVLQTRCLFLFKSLVVNILKAKAYHRDIVSEAWNQCSRSCVYSRIRSKVHVLQRVHILFRPCRLQILHVPGRHASGIQKSWDHVLVLSPAVRFAWRFLVRSVRVGAWGRTTGAGPPLMARHVVRASSVTWRWEHWVFA